jgi:hypothetical protein
MTRPVPSFPAFDEWQSMSEREQDALLDKLDTANRRGSLTRSILVAVLGLATCAVIGLVLVMLGP